MATVCYYFPWKVREARACFLNILEIVTEQRAQKRIDGIGIGVEVVVFPCSFYWVGTTGGLLC